MSLLSILGRMKSNCQALFSYYSGAQLCDRRIHSVIKLGKQSFPRQNNMSLNVSESDKGFIQKSFLRSLGHSFRGEKVSPLMALQSSRLFSMISCLLSKRSLSLNKCSEDIVKMRQRNSKVVSFYLHLFQFVAMTT